MKTNILPNIAACLLFFFIPPILCPFNTSAAPLPLSPPAAVNIAYKEQSDSMSGQTMRISVINAAEESIRELEDYCRLNHIKPEYVSCIFLAVSALAALLVYQRLRHHREVSIELEKRLRVYALTNDYFFEYQHQKKQMAISISSPDEPSGVKLRYFDYSSEEKRSKASELLDVFTSQSKGIRECRVLCEDGLEHWLRVAFEHIYGDNKELLCTIGKINVIDSEKAELNALETKALLDSLTGVYNVQTCQDKIEAALSRIKEGEAAAFLLLDIDHFKLINDIYGHKQGDMVLCRLTELIRCNVRKDDIIGRFGGDEFIVYFPGISDKKTLESRCNLLRGAIREDCLNTRQTFTISMGAVFTFPGCHYKDLFQAADSALYSAKAQGRNCFVIAGQEETCASAELPPPQWLVDPHYQMALRSIGAVSFEFVPSTRAQYVSPFISGSLSGNYKGRRLFDVLLEDQVIHPDDREMFGHFLEGIYEGRDGETTLRLMSASGKYRWYKIVLTSCGYAEKTTLMGLITDVDAQTRQSELLRYLAELDPISGIYNKGTFFARTKELLDREPDEQHFIIRFDINRFKLVNEFYSVSEGDKVLRHIGIVISQMCGPGETYGRMGDDVFCLCISRSRPEVISFIQDLEKEINSYSISYQLILSVGILQLRHYEGEPVNILCDRAALAQRTIKGNYVNRYAFFERSMGDTLNREHYITGLMRQALENHEFQVYFQPKYDMPTGRIIGAESLVRWRQPKEGVISPGEFIPLFERNGFILPLDEYVWDMTFRHMRDWLDRGITVVPVSVNVSRMHLYDPRFCDKVISLREKYNLPPKLMEMEITESAYTEYPQKLYGIMDKLQEQGFVFSMDDFGSGYSSLNVLKDIPVDVVKIDLNFLKDARRGQKAGRAVLEGTIKLVRSIGLPIIAEGVETKEQVEFLQKAGCTAAQGYYYARPMPARDFEELLRNFGSAETEP